MLSGCLVEVAGEEPLQLLLGFLPASLLLGHGTRELGLVDKVLALDQFGVLVLAELVQNCTNKASRVISVGLHVSHNHLDVDILALSTPPAVVVSGHADHLVGDFGLAGQLSLRQGRHVDDGSAPAAVHVGLGASAELRSLHADDGALVVQRNAIALQAVTTLAHKLGQLDVKGVAKPNVANHALLEVCEGADALGAVDDLVGDYEVARADLLLQRANGGEGDDGAHAEVTQRRDVGLVLHLVGRKLVGETVAREEGDGHILAGRGRGVVQDANGRGRLAPWRVDI